MEAHSPKRRRLSPRVPAAAAPASASNGGGGGGAHAARGEGATEQRAAASRAVPVPGSKDKDKEEDNDTPTAKVKVKVKAADVKPKQRSSLPSHPKKHHDRHPPDGNGNGNGIGNGSGKKADKTRRPEANNSSANKKRKGTVITPQDAIAPINTPGSTQSIERIRDLSLASTKKSPARPDPRPLPPPAPEGDDELTSIRLALGRDARWSPNLGLSPSIAEPELPPSVPDVVSSAPARGIHSSPSKWRSKTKSKANKKSSPLKPQMGRAEGKADLDHGGVMSPRTSLNLSRDDALSVPLDQRCHPMRQVPALDADASKRKERDALRDEVARLKRDLQIVNKENEHIRLMQSSGRVISSQDEDAVMDVIQRHLIDAENPSPPPVSQQLMKAALNPVGLGLLPFSRPTALVAVPEEQDVSVSDIKSHRPLPMTAEEELPYLQLFSPFTVTSTIALLPQLANQPVRQRRIMTFRSKDGLGLFTSKVEMTIDAMNLNILELKVMALEPAARAELTPFLDKICTGDCNRSMQRNVGILSWAMGDWYRVALRRAGLWAQLDDQLAAKGGLLRATGDMRQRKKRRRRQDHDSGEEEQEVEGAGAAQQAVSARPANVLQYMGQQFLDLGLAPSTEATESSASLRLEWKIEFDWTGEAQSRVAVLVGVPGKWRNADQRDVFGKLPHLFQDLVEGGEDLSTAVKTIAALLVGDRGGQIE